MVRSALLEFIGKLFGFLSLHVFSQFGSTTVKNPQADLICERFHQTIGSLLRTMLLVKPMFQ
jgi:hypothetical protein